MRVPLSSADLSDTRLVISPWWETLMAVRTLAGNATMHRPWSEAVRRDLAGHSEAGEHWERLRTFITSSGFMADSLTPTPRADQSMEQARRAVEAVPHAAWEPDLAALRAIGERPSSPAILEAFAADPADGVARLCDAVEFFHGLAVAPYWDRIRAVHVADIDFRSRLLASGGLEAVLATLHPHISRLPDGLDVYGKTCPMDGIAVTPGLTLIPSAFAWPGVQILYAPGQAVTLSYVPRGIATLWESASDGGAEGTALSGLLGFTRANILRALDVPMTTTQLSGQLCLAAATISAHLKALSGATLLSTSRKGREVFYARTPLGAQLARV